jgi:Zn-dependent protease with chaperone function
VAGVLFYGQGGDGSLWFPDVFAVVSLGTLAIISAGSLYKIAELAGGGEVVARSLGGRPVLSATRDLRERVLLNVVEEMAIASGTPVPPVFLLDHESAINAFAAGTSPQNAVIAVTRGSIETLSRDQLQGVIAHEFSHIQNGDMRLNLRLIGILNGILVIAMIGYLLMRFSSSSQSSDSSGEKKGTNPLPLLGFCLYVIGYVGIFFGHLIKSAVSRQREFLADASAVQFTRLPDGIAGALKKIGGLVAGSRLAAPQAEEASHMLFGNGLAQPLFGLLATHPPLDERIRRIDPTFDGRFPLTTSIEYSPADLRDPTTLAARRAALANIAPLGPGDLAAPSADLPPVAEAAAAATDVGASAGARGSQTFAFEPAAAVAQVGAPRSEHLDYAAALLGRLPAEFSAAARDPLGAVATVYALLLDADEGAVRRGQFDYLASQSDPHANAETLRLAPLAARLQPQDKLPLVSLVLPALKNLSPSQLAAFHKDVNVLIEADHQVSLFEYAIHRLIRKRLLGRLERQEPPAIKYERLDPLIPACSTLLSALAYCGTRDDREAARALALGVARLPPAGAGVELLPPSARGLKSIDGALDQFAAAAPLLKRSLLRACAACIGADGRVTVPEGELLRVISDALDSPMPPLLGAPV